MSIPAKLSYTAKLVCVDTLLFGHGAQKSSELPQEMAQQTTSVETLLDNQVTQGEYLLQLLETDCFTAVSEDILERIVEQYPSRLTNRLLAALLPPYAREINLPDCTDRLTLMGLLEGLKKCSHIQRLNLQGCSQLLHPDIFTLMGLINGQLTTLILEGNSNVTDEIVQTAIRALPNLTTLNISGSSSITDDVFLVDPILQLKRETSQKLVEGDYSYKLSSVDMSGISRITSVAVRHLCSLCGPNLRQLNLAWSAVDSTVLFYLAGYNFPSIIDLVLGMESELRKERELKEYLQELKEIKDLYLLQEQESQSDQTEAGMERSNSTGADVTLGTEDDQQEHTVSDKPNKDFGLSDKLKLGSDRSNTVNETSELDNCEDIDKTNTPVQLKDVNVDVCQVSSLNSVHGERDDSCFQRESFSGEESTKGNNHFKKDSIDRRGSSSECKNIKLIESFNVDVEGSLNAEDRSDQCENVQLIEPFKTVGLEDEKGVKNNDFGAKTEGNNQIIDSLARTALNSAQRISMVINKDEIDSDMDSDLVIGPKKVECVKKSETNKVLDEIARKDEFQENGLQGNVTAKFFGKLSAKNTIGSSCLVCPNVEQQIDNSRSTCGESVHVNSQRNFTHSPEGISVEDSYKFNAIKGQSLDDDLVDHGAIQTGAKTYAKNIVNTDEQIKRNKKEGNQHNSGAAEINDRPPGDNPDIANDTQHKTELHCSDILGDLSEKDVSKANKSKTLETTQSEKIHSDIEEDSNRHIDDSASPHGANMNQNTASSHCDISEHSDKDIIDTGIKTVLDVTTFSSSIEIMNGNQGEGSVNTNTVISAINFETESKPVILSEDNKSSVTTIQNTNIVQLGSKNDTSHADKVGEVNCVTSSEHSGSTLTKSIDLKNTELANANEKKMGPSGTGFPCQIVFKPGLVSLDITNIKFMNRKLGQLCLKTFLQQNPCLQKLELSWKGLTEELLKEVLPNLRNLLEVSLEECTFIQNGGLSAMLKQCQQLRNINLRGVVFIKDMAMSPLYTMANLTKLNLAESEISDATLFRISNRCSEKLTELDLSWCEGITEKGINYICLKCTQLQSLVLRSCPVSNITLQVMAKHCLQLTELIIDSVEGVSSNDFGDMGLIEIAENLFQLQTLDISWNLSITNLAVSLLMGNLSKLKEVHMKGLKQITCSPFLPIISGVRDEDGNVKEFWIDEYCNNIMTAGSLKRSTAFVPNLSVLDLEYSDLVEDKRLELIVKVCRGSLLVTDYYGRQLVPDDSSSLVISSASVKI